MYYYNTGNNYKYLFIISYNKVLCSLFLEFNKTKISFLRNLYANGFLHVKEKIESKFGLDQTRYHLEKIFDYSIFSSFKTLS